MPGVYKTYMVRMYRITDELANVRVLTQNSRNTISDRGKVKFVAMKFPIHRILIEAGCIVITGS